MGHRIIQATTTSEERDRQKKINAALDALVEAVESANEVIIDMINKARFYEDKPYLVGISTRTWHEFLMTHDNLKDKLADLQAGK